MNKRTYERLYYALCACLMVVMLLTALLGAARVFAFSGSPVGQNYIYSRADEVTSDTENVSSDEKTGYYLDLPLKDLVFEFTPEASRDISMSVGAGNAWLLFYKIEHAVKVLSNTAVHLLFTFNDLSYYSEKYQQNLYPVVNYNVTTEFKLSGNWFSCAMYGAFKENARVNLREEYYDLFKSAKADNLLKNVSITLVCDGGFGAPVLNNTTSNNVYLMKNEWDLSACSVYEDEYTDDGQLPDNGGNTNKPVVVEGASFLDTIVSAFNSHSTPIDWAVIVGTCLVALIAVSLVLRLLGLIFGLFRR